MSNAAITQALANALYRIREFMHSALEGGVHPADWHHYDEIATGALDLYEGQNGHGVCGRCGSTPSRRDLTCQDCTTLDGEDRLVVPPKVRILVGAESPYACILGNGYSLDVRLAGGTGPVKALRQVADEERRRANLILNRVAKIEAAAKVLEKEAAEASTAPTEG